MAAIDGILIKYKTGISPVMEAILAFLEKEPSETMVLCRYFSDNKVCSLLTAYNNLYTAIGLKLIVSYHDKKNRRKKLVKLTEKGKAYLGKVRKNWID